MLHPVALSPRCSNVVRAARKSSGCPRTEKPDYWDKGRKDGKCGDARPSDRPHPEAIPATGRAARPAWGQLVEHLRQRIAEGGIIAHYLRSQQCVAQGIEHDLIVHGATCRDRTVLGRHRRSHHPPLVGRMFDEEIQKETSRTLQYRIIGFQEIFIRSEQVVLPQMLGQPCPTARPHTGRRKIHHAADTPKVGVMVSHPSPQLYISRAVFAPVTDKSSNMENKGRCISLRLVTSASQ